MVNKDLRTRTQGEELWLARRALGRTQAAQARALGVSRGRLSLLELDAAQGGPRVRFEPSLPLLLALARRRSRLGLRGVARAAGVSHRTLLKWEARADPKLVEFWVGRGFTFARQGR